MGKIKYNITMYNWSVDEEKFKKNDSEGHKIWRLEQLINFGLGGEKLNAAEVKKYLTKLNIDEPARKYLEFLL